MLDAEIVGYELGRERFWIGVASSKAKRGRRNRKVKEPKCSVD